MAGSKRKKSTRGRGKKGIRQQFRFLGRANSAVRAHLSGATDLPTFLASTGGLTLNGRRRLVEQALLLFEGNYVHLPLKEAMHGVDPVQRLRLVQHRQEHATAATMGSEYEFHREMLEIFNSVRDLHTNYLLPAPFADMVAFLPFDVEEYYDEDGEPHYLAAHFMEGFMHPLFNPGVEITSWSGAPIRRAIQVSAHRHAGSNLAARWVRGLDGLTVRPLRMALPPDARWVVVGYVDGDGNERETRQEWLVSPPLPDSDGVDPDSASLNAASLGLDEQADLVRRAKKMLFAPNVVAETRKKRRRLSSRLAVAGESVTSTMPEVFNASNEETPSGDFAYIRLRTFNVDDPEAFVEEFVRLAGLLPQEGMILDVRGNGGGHIWASEGLLQILTPREIEPEPVQWVTTPLNLRICRRHEDNPVGIDLGPWVDSIDQAVETGAVYSRGFPITPLDFANRWGQRYHGPVVLVTDARCYSATDIFAAGFKDHEIGTILGLDSNTGAGGANVFTHNLLRQLLALPSPADPASPYATLPSGAGMRVSVRRTLRVGERSGTPLEDLGVRPDVEYRMTRDDLLESNRDLIARAGEILAGLPVRRLTAVTARNDPKLSLTVTTAGLDRLDTYVDGRPVESLQVSDGDTTFEVDVPAGQVTVELAGHDGGSYVAARKLLA